MVDQSQCLASHKPDIAFETNRVERSSATPTRADHLCGTLDLGFNLQIHTNAPTVFTDSDWASDRPARKSVSSWMILLDETPISANARTHSVIAPSSCEAE